MLSSAYGTGSVPELPLTAFGEVAVESKTPQVQIKFPYGINPEIAQSLTNKAGSALTSADGNATITCDGSAEALAQLRTYDTLRYGPGQGGLFKGTCIFTEGQPLSSQVIGAGDDDEGYFWGYNGVDFGILIRARGSLEIKSLEITNGASSSGNITITLDGTAVVIAVSAGDAISDVSAKIVAEHAAFFNAGRGWQPHTDDNLAVEFISMVAESAGGTFSFADTDSTGVTAGSFAQEVTGVVPVENWIPSTSFNVDKLDGSGPSGMTINPTKGNVLKIQFQYLGYGMIIHSVENKLTGKFQIANQLEYSNTNTLPTLRNPSLHLSVIAKTEIGYTGPDIVMSTASLAGFIQGKETDRGTQHSISNSKDVGTTPNVILILHNEVDFNGQINRITTFIKRMTITSESSKTTTVSLIREPTIVVGATALTDVHTGVSVMQWSGDGTTVTGGEMIESFTLIGGGSEKFKFDDGELNLRPGDRIVMVANHSSGASAPVTISTTIKEKV